MPPIFARSRRRSPSRTIELRRRLPDGSIRWVQWADTAIFDDEGRLVEIQSVGRDVTEQRNSELALRASEASYRALVETQTEFVLRQRPDGRLTFVNEAYCRYVGKPREQLLDAVWNDLDDDRGRGPRGLCPAPAGADAGATDGGDRGTCDPARRLRALGAVGRHRHLRR